MAKPTDAPLPKQYFQGGARLTEDVDGLRRYLNELAESLRGHDVVGSASSYGVSYALR